MASLQVFTNTDMCVLAVCFVIGTWIWLSEHEYLIGSIMDHHWEHHLTPSFNVIGLLPCMKCHHENRHVISSFLFPSESVRTTVGHRRNPQVREDRNNHHIYHHTQESNSPLLITSACVLSQAVCHMGRATADWLSNNFVINLPSCLLHSFILHPSWCWF